jgi:hypothetical protein
LSAVFGADPDEAVEAVPSPEPLPVDPIYAGLSPVMADFARALCERDAWDREELNALAKAHKVMLEGSIERLNDWALDRWGDLLIEEGEPTRVARELMNHLVSA